MTKFLLALHLVLAIFAIGPLVHAATTAGRGIRRGDAAATASSARVLRIYAYVSVLVTASGIVLMYRPANADFGWYAYSPLQKDGILYGGSGHSGPDYLRSHLASYGQTWIWLSIVLWVLTVALVLFVAVPTLKKATNGINNGDSVGTLTGRVAATGGVIGLIFVAITVLMVYRPGR